MIASQTAAEFPIGGRIVGPGQPALIIGEVAQAHDGSLGMAHAYIDAIARAGADAVKFQTHIAAAESTRSEPWRVKFSHQDDTRYEYWQRMEFTPSQWSGLKSHADDAGLLFLSSPFSEQAVDLLEALAVPAWKTASGEVENHVLLQRMAATQKPMLLSSGMSSWQSLDEAVACILREGAPIAVMQCTTAYPCPPEQVGLNLLPDLRERYQCAVGLSDHSGTIYPALAATNLGVEVIEVHVTMSREMFGPDVSSSVTTAELRQLVDGVRFTERMLSSPCDKDQRARELADLRATFGKSIVLRQDLPAGTRLERPHVALKKPGSGLPPQAIQRVLGRRLTCAAVADQPLTDDMLSD